MRQAVLRGSQGTRAWSEVRERREWCSGGQGQDAGGDGDEVVKGEGLVEGVEGVEAVFAWGADGEAEVDLGVGADGGGHVREFLNRRCI